jgi:hypothetical protein
MTCICAKLVSVAHANCFIKSHWIYFYVFLVLYLKTMSLDSLKIVKKNSHRRCLCELQGFVVVISESHLGELEEIVRPRIGSVSRDHCLCVCLWRRSSEVRATSHTSQEPWPWNCESPKENCPKAIPTHLQNHVVWSQTLKCSVKSYVPGPQPNAISMNFYSCRSSRMIKNKINQWLWVFGVPWSPNFVLGLPPRDGFWKWS